MPSVVRRSNVVVTENRTGQVGPPQDGPLPRSMLGSTVECALSYCCYCPSGHLPKSATSQQSLPTRNSDHAHNGIRDRLYRTVCGAEKRTDNWCPVAVSASANNNDRPPCTMILPIVAVVANHRIYANNSSNKWPLICPPSSMNAIVIIIIETIPRSSKKDASCERRYHVFRQCLDRSSYGMDHERGHSNMPP
jgi:hypothetical protein